MLLLPMLAACSDAGHVAHETYPDMDSDGFKIFSSNCSACHAPPQPTAHLAREWPGVIERMQTHRIQRGLGEVPAAQLKQLREYLTGHARKEGA